MSIDAGVTSFRALFDPKRALRCRQQSGTSGHRHAARPENGPPTLPRGWRNDTREGRRQEILRQWLHRDRLGTVTAHVYREVRNVPKVNRTEGSSMSPFRPQNGKRRKTSAPAVVPESMACWYCRVVEQWVGDVGREKVSARVEGGRTAHEGGAVSKQCSACSSPAAYGVQVRRRGERISGSAEQGSRQLECPSWMLWASRPVWSV